jgi:hypothetical protein
MAVGFIPVNCVSRYRLNKYNSPYDHKEISWGRTIGTVTNASKENISIRGGTDGLGTGLPEISAGKMIGRMDIAGKMAINKDWLICI